MVVIVSWGMLGEASGSARVGDRRSDDLSVFSTMSLSVRESSLQAGWWWCAFVFDST